MNINREVFSGVAEGYHTYRPTPPLELPALLMQLAQTSFPALVVDLGCGTGGSTLPWVGRAQAVIGIEPNADMLRVAWEKGGSLPPTSNVTFRQGEGSQTGLADGSADIVTCSQSFHWMEPQSTLAEILRILRPGGVFAAYDHQWPPTLDWRAEKAYETFMARVEALEALRDPQPNYQIWTQNRTLAPLQENGHFRYVRELWLHHQEIGNAERFVGLTLSNGVVQSLRKGLFSEDEIGLPSFRQTVQEIVGDTPIPWYFSYHLRIAVK